MTQDNAGYIVYVLISSKTHSGKMLYQGDDEAEARATFHSYPIRHSEAVVVKYFDGKAEARRDRNGWEVL